LLHGDDKPRLQGLWSCMRVCPRDALIPVGPKSAVLDIERSLAPLDRPCGGGS
jgi:hypothetical protein